MKYYLLLLLFPVIIHTQDSQQHYYKEKRWLLNSGINLPAVKFHITDKSQSESNGHLELFSSFGLGLSINFGEASFYKSPEQQKFINDQTEFRNIIGLQLGLLYSSKVNEFDYSQINLFSIYSGINVLDLQIGGGYEFGSRIIHSTGWFVSMSYGIPIYKITGTGSYLFKKKTNRNLQPKCEYAFL